MNIGILGAGSWSIALAVLLAKRGHSLCLWEVNKEDALMLQEKKEHPVKLPGVTMPDSVVITNELSDVMDHSEMIICAVPAQFVRITMQNITKTIPHSTIDKIRGWVIVSKGIEISSMKLLSEIIVDELPNMTDQKLVALSGPSHAEEVSRHIPTTVVAASPNNRLAVEVQDQFSTETFRIYTNNDITGVELCASIKNVIALAAGICDGMGFGDNTKGALLTRGMAEMARLGKEMGADEATFSGLAGFGDLITTCISKHSRNRHMGELLASGLSLENALKQMTMVSEGVATAKAVYNLAMKHKIDMPIITEVYKTLYEGKHPLQAVKDLMQRPFKSETH